MAWRREALRSAAAVLLGRSTKGRGRDENLWVFRFDPALAIRGKTSGRDQHADGWSILLYSKQFVTWTASAFRCNPVDNLVGIHNVAGFAMDTIGRINLQAAFA